MKKSVKVIIAVAVIAVAVAAAVAVIFSRSGSSGEDKTETTTVAVKVEYPSFVTNTAPVSQANNFPVYTADKRVTYLRDLTGQPVVVCFWNEYSQRAIEEADMMQELYEKYGDRVHFLMINTEDEYKYTEHAQEFAKQRGYTFPLYFDIDTHASSSCGLYTVPHVEFIDKDGYFYELYKYESDGKTAEQIILELLETKHEKGE